MVIPMVKDAALIGAAQRIEHYEIAAYGTTAAHLRSNSATRTQSSSCNKRSTKKRKLTKSLQLATSEINAQAPVSDA